MDKVFQKLFSSVEKGLAKTNQYQVGDLVLVKSIFVRDDKLQLSVIIDKFLTDKKCNIMIYKVYNFSVKMELWKMSNHIYDL